MHASSKDSPCWHRAVPKIAVLTLTQRLMSRKPGSRGVLVAVLSDRAYLRVTANLCSNGEIEGTTADQVRTRPSPVCADL